MHGNSLAGFALLLLIIPSRIDGAQEPKPTSVSQATDSNRSKEESYSKEPYVYELIESHVRFEADGKGQRDLVARVRIQSESAVHEFGLMAYPYASSFESLEIVFVRVRKPNGTVIETPVSDVQEVDSAVSREAPMYTDQREKHIAVKSLSVGDILEAHLRWTIHDPMAPGHFWYDDSYFRSGICLEETLQIDVPLNVPVKLRYSEAPPTVREEGGRRVYAFKSANLKKPKESKIPEWEKNFHGAPPPDIQLSSFSSWEEIGKWFGSLEQTKVAVSPEIRAKAEELTKGKTSEEEKLNVLYDFVSARFRYIAIDLGVSRFTPHAASDVLVNRYGDCKDKHTLLAALLQAVGIPSYPVLISSKYRVDASFPTMSLFDHVITAIPRAESLLFLDTTPEVAPYGLLVQNIRDRQALVIPNNSAARLVTTPADPPFTSYERLRVDSSIDVHGTLDAKMRLEDRGDGELALRLAYRATPQNRWQELTQNIVARLGFGGTVSDVTVAQPEDTDKPFWIDFSYHRTDYPDWKNHRITLPAPPIFLASLSEEQKLSKDPLPLGALEEITYDASMKFPHGYTPIVPEKVEQKSDFAEFTATYSLEKGILRGVFHLKTLLHEVPGTERSRFSGLFKDIDETARRYIFVSGDFPTVDSASGQLLALLPSRPEDAIPVLEKNLSEDSDKKYTLLLLSQAYCKTGRPKDAITILEKALAKNPDDSQDLYAALGHAYLAVPDGDKALLQFQKALGDKPEPAQVNDVAYALADANARLEDALAYSTHAVSSIASQTMDISPDDAEPSDFALMPQLAANWDTFGWIKFRMGDMAAAEKYLEAAWQLMQAPTIGEHLVEVYEKLCKKQKAAVVCNMAEAALGSTVTPADAPVREKIAEEMKRLRPFLTSPSTSSGTKTRSTPPDAHAALADMRSMNIPLPTKLHRESGKANFVISLANGPKADNVVFVSGTEELRNAIAALAAVKYAQTFPDGTPTRIVRKASLNCSVYSKDCLLFITTVEEASGNLPFNIPVKTLKEKPAN